MCSSPASLNDWPAVSMGLRSETGTSVVTEDREGGEQGQQLQEKEREELSRLLEGQVGGFAASSSLGGRRRRGPSPEARARREKRDFASLRHVADSCVLASFVCVCVCVDREPKSAGVC